MKSSIIANKAKRLILETFFPYRFKYLVASFGGSCTSMLIKFLNPMYGTVTNYMYYHLELKHVRRPPTNLEHDFKAIYLFGNPINAVLSIFNRNLQEVHFKNIFGNSRQYTPLTFDEFINNGKDIFDLDEHFNNWTTSSRQERHYPIMLIKAVTMWEHLSELFDFLEISGDRIQQFPEYQQRSSNWETEPKEIRERLYQMYGSLYEKIQKFPEITVI